jgi:molybdopterin synthase catalytic subunit
MITVRIEKQALDSAAELAPLERLGGGAVASFTGIARRDSDVTAIELEHFPGMTETSLGAIARQALERWNLLAATIIHRVGRIEVGEPIVFVAAAAVHRAEALEACSYLIDRLKTDAPFWKKEHYANGSSAWVDAKVSDTARAEKWS